MKWVRLSCGLLVCGLSSVLWWVNMSRSPFMDHDIQIQRKYLRALYDTLAPDLEEQRLLARDYWLRYPGVRNDPFWGEKSLLGIQGPADHYRQHGRREGRIYARIERPKDMELEKVLAERYWQRYPGVAKSPIWGRTSSMGVLGPRDHYRFYGKRQGLQWGEESIE